MRTVLTIAGSDCSGGAGIQADLKTIGAHCLYGMSVLTALTAQNTTGVLGVKEVPASFVASQLDCVLKDIPPDAVKIGMVGSWETIQMIAEKLAAYSVQKIVVDPVMISTSGTRLLPVEAVKQMEKVLFPQSSLITPNIPEAQFLWGEKIDSPQTMEAAARELGNRYGTAVLIKGGHMADRADDLLYWEGQLRWFTGCRVDNPNTHGTGCTLSSAIACRLAEGRSLPDSVMLAKDYLLGALEAKLNLGKGNGPLDHFYNFRSGQRSCDR